MPKVTINGTIDPQRVFDALAAQIGCTAVLVPKVKEPTDGTDRNDE